MTEEFDLQRQRKKAHRRLVGAVVFAIVIAFAVPKILRYKPKYHPEEVLLTLPKQEASSKSDNTPLPEEASAEHIQMPVDTAASQPTEEKRTPQATSHKIVVQLGAFGNVANAKSLQMRAQSFGVRTYTEQLTTAGGKTVVRVRAGPFETMEDAKQVSDKLRAAGLPAVVIAD